MVNIEYFPKSLFESWGYQYIEPVYKKQQSFAELEEEMEAIGASYYELYYYAIFAIALGQIKITGKVNKKLKDLAALAFSKMLSLSIYKDKVNTESLGKKWTFKPGKIDEPELIRISYEDLMSF